MKRTSFLLLCLLPLLLSAQTSWVKWWPQPQAESVWPNNIIKTYDGGYAFHWTYYFHDQFDEYYEDRLFKTDSLGNLLWEQQWSVNLSTPELNTLNQMPDSSYLWAGRYIVKVTPDGQIAWSIDLDTLIANGAEIYTSTLTPDGNVVFVAYKHNGLGDDYWWILKIDSNGNVLWLHPYQFEYLPIQIKMLTDRRMILIGWFNNGEFLLLKFTDTGVLYASQIVNNPNIHHISGMIVDSQTYLLVYGSALTSSQSQLFYLDSLGNFLWDKHIELPDTNLAIDGIVSALENSDSSFVMTSWGIGTDNINAIIQTNKSGNVEWWQQLPGSALDGSSFVSQCNLVNENHGYVMGLRKQGNSRTIGIAKTDSNGIITKIENINNNIPQSLILHQNFPNPFNPTTTIKFQLPKTSRVKLEIYNLLGQKINTLVNGFKQAGSYQVKWNGTNYSGNQVGSGIYIYRFTGVATDGSEKYTGTKKMLLVR